MARRTFSTALGVKGALSRSSESLVVWARRRVAEVERTDRGLGGLGEGRGEVVEEVVVVVERKLESRGRSVVVKLWRDVVGLAGVAISRCK
jgi:hypothetical protein